MQNPYLWGFLAIALLVFISSLSTKKLNPLELARGVYKNFSVSLLQFLIFTYVTVFSYVAIFVARLSSSKTDNLNTILPGIPINLLILMGLSVITATASKGIVVSYAEQGQLPASTEGNDNLVKDKTGNIALTKVQMLIWTFIAAAIYLTNVIEIINNSSTVIATTLPNVDGSLLVLMGASQGGYIGGKLVSRKTATPTIQDILPAPASLANTTKSEYPRQSRWFDKCGRLKGDHLAKLENRLAGGGAQSSATTYHQS